MKSKRKTLSIIISIFILSLSVNMVTVKAGNINVNARCAIALDSRTKTVLYEKDAQMIVPMASTTKIITSLVAIKYGNLDKKVVISEKSANIHGSTVGYKKGEEVTIRELLYGLMLKSGNDAAIAISEGIAGSEEEFVKLMNEISNEIGLCSTHFESPHGLDSDAHYSTAYDLALATARAREYNIFNEIVQSKVVDNKVTGFTRSYNNINKILWELPNATGVKTGSTGKAGKCLVTSVNIKGNDVVIVVLNCTPRWKETKKINDYVEKNYEFKKYFSKGDKVDTLVFEGNKGKINLISPKDIIIPLKKDNSYKVEIIKPNYKIEDKIKKGDKIGSLLIKENDKVIYSTFLEAEGSKKDETKRKFKFLERFF